MPIPVIYALVISIIILILLVKIKINISYSFLATAIIFGILSYPLHIFIKKLYTALTDYFSIQLIIIFILIFFFAMYLYEVGALKELIEEVSNINASLAAILIPAFIGLIPMPGGALISAIMVKDLYFNRLKLSGGYAAYLNYWFRHIWIAIWPIYQCIIISAYILHISVDKLITITWPISVTAIISGLILSYKLLLVKSKANSKANILRILKHTSPFIVIFILTVIVGLSLLSTIAIITVIVLLIYGIKKKPILKAIQFSLSPQILALVIAAIIFKHLFSSGDLSNEVLSVLKTTSIPDVFFIFLLPLLLSFISANEYITFSISYPILNSIYDLSLHNNYIYLSYLGGYLGAYLSPLHICLILTSQYYEINMVSVYKYILTSIAIMITLSLIIYYVYFPI